MIQVEWHSSDGVKCGSCGRANHAQAVDITVQNEGNDPALDVKVLRLCSDCIADLKQKLS